MKQLSQRRRAQLGLFVIVILNMGVYIWSIIMQVKFSHNDPGAIDWDDSLYPSAFLPYFFVQTTGPLSQSYMYWLISSFATDAQSNVRNGAAFRWVLSERDEAYILTVSQMCRGYRSSYCLRHEH